ncbi:MAG: 16S rRNA (guanine(527)-N(7))-methyltransferase RsmG [Rubrivivax sp.]
MASGINSAPAEGAEQSLAAWSAELGLTPSPNQLQAIERFLDLLMRWNRTYNLTAVRDRGAMRTQHVVDCLALVPPLLRHAATHRVESVLDVGSGGGLPGVLIAILNPALAVTCVDAVAKKAAFVRHVAGALELRNLQSTHARVQDLSVERPRYDLITSRAFASLLDFVLWTEGTLQAGGAWVAMKGAHPHAELDALPPWVEVFHVEPLQVPGLSARRCLVWMKRGAESDALPSAARV